MSKNSLKKLPRFCKKDCETYYSSQQQEFSWYFQEVFCQSTLKIDSLPGRAPHGGWGLGLAHLIGPPWQPRRLFSPPGENYGPFNLELELGLFSDMHRWLQTGRSPKKENCHRLLYLMSFQSLMGVNVKPCDKVKGANKIHYLFDNKHCFKLSRHV